MAKKKSAKTTTVKPIKGVLSKSGLVAQLAETSELSAKQVRNVMAALEAVIHASVSKRGAGVFVLPGVLKVTAVNVPAKPKRKGINPFTGLEQMFKAKPASIKIKVRAMKKLKDAASV